MEWNVNDVKSTWQWWHEGGSESVARDVGDGRYRQRGERFKEPMQGLKV